MSTHLFTLKNTNQKRAIQSLGLKKSLAKFQTLVKMPSKTLTKWGLSVLVLRLKKVIFL
ncbi:Uncharacterised protein [Mycobacterium tuberculosis]|uniref:Uncharacterized protein n=1 Tax=Mycobacterium tuberculosis TaxID=1773 RepID=A0A655AS05_MYCTX|nr:Uncharacterised protein [Mycobacterium tuberculosis]